LESKTPCFFDENILKVITSVPDEFLKISPKTHCQAHMHYFSPLKQEDKIVIWSSMFYIPMYLPKENNHAMGKNLSSLVTLVIINKKKYIQKLQLRCIRGYYFFQKLTNFDQRSLLICSWIHVHAVTW
jgi:hypothetical protein